MHYATAADIGTAREVFDDLKVLGLIDDEYEDANKFFTDLHRAAELQRGYDATDRIASTFEDKLQWAVVEFENGPQTTSTHPVFHGDENGAKVDNADSMNKGDN